MSIVDKESFDSSVSFNTIHDLACLPNATCTLADRIADTNRIALAQLAMISKIAHMGCLLGGMFFLGEGMRSSISGDYKFAHTFIGIMMLSYAVELAYFIDMSWRKPFLESCKLKYYGDPKQL